MPNKELRLKLESLQTELKRYSDKPYDCLFEYIWNSFDANATQVEINYDTPENGLGYISKISIQDNGTGWDFANEDNTHVFLYSTKKDQKNKNKSLPHGSYGKGRYVFIWIAESLDILSKNQKLTLKKDTKVVPIEDKSAPKVGTKVVFQEPHVDFYKIFNNLPELFNQIILEFCWFLKENPEFSISINGQRIDYEQNIKEEKILLKKDFSEDIQNHIQSDLKINIIFWKNKPREWSNFYFIDQNNREISKQSSGMNKKNDDFWHAVYFQSDFFKRGTSESNEEGQLDLPIKEDQKILNKIIRRVKEELVKLRKPYLIEKSGEIISELKRDGLIPNLSEFGIFDEHSYEELLKTLFVISPQLFVGKDKKEKKFICATFAGLLSSQDANLIKIIIEQLQDLDDTEKTDLLNILNRTSLSSIVRTIKEVDHRLQAISDLEALVFTYEKQTLEVKHLQRVLNENFWIFGEKFRLFQHTEGALKNTLYRYAKDILNIDNPDISSKSRKEVDLFLVRTDPIDEQHRHNVVVEIKRPSITLGKAEFDQIEQYSIEIIKESVCNSNNITWEFYLIGDEYDDYIKIQKIEAAKNYGEMRRGLASSAYDGRVKIYVRKWSDILKVEWGYKMRYLKDTLKIKAENFDDNNPDDIVARTTNH